jgi:hypothetical protein
VGHRLQKSDPLVRVRANVARCPKAIEYDWRSWVEQRQYLTVNIIPLIRLGWSLLETFARRRRRPAGMENEGDLPEAKLNPSHRFATWVDQPKTRARYG